MDSTVNISPSVWVAIQPALSEAIAALSLCLEHLAHQDEVRLGDIQRVNDILNGLPLTTEASSGQDSKWDGEVITNDDGSLETVYPDTDWRSKLTTLIAQLEANGQAAVVANLRALVPPRVTRDDRTNSINKLRDYRRWEKAEREGVQHVLDYLQALAAEHETLESPPKPEAEIQGAPPPTGDTGSKGVSLRDAAELCYSDEPARIGVKPAEWRRRRVVRCPKPIGKCDNDGRVSLYNPDELVAFLRDAGELDSSSEIPKMLRLRARPVADS